jgi:hypothetical protein
MRGNTEVSVSMAVINEMMSRPVLQSAPNASYFPASGNAHFLTLKYLIIFTLKICHAKI